MTLPLRRFSPLALVLSFATAANTARAADGAKDIVIGEEHPFFSKILNEQRTILVGKPARYDEEDERYAVLFALDGDASFQYTSAVAGFLAGNQLIPNLLVVGIPNTVRPRDLTPPATDPFTREQEPKHGGSAKFRAFVAEELIPWVERNYRTRPYRILAGHSYGGLFAIDTLLTQPRLFKAYIAISPSLWWDDQRLVERAEAFFGTKPDMDVSLFITTGDDARGLRGSVKKLAGVLDERAPPELQWRFEYLPSESHGSVPLRSTYKGLEFIFADWKLRNPLEIYERFGIEGIERFHERANRKYGYETRGVPEEVIAELSRDLLAAGRLDELTGLLARYRGTVQPPARVLERIASGYREQGRTDRAIELYRQALQTDPTSEVARQALTELDGENHITQ